MKRIISALFSVLLVMSLASCGEDKPPVNDADEFKIATSFYPVYVATLNVIDGAEGVTLLNLTDPDVGCLHDYILTPDDIKKLTGTDLFIASGMNMESCVGKTSFGIPRLEVLECGEDIKNVIGDEGEENPHYWMNIENAILQCDKIKRTLCRLDPENADIYEANAAGYKEKLSKLLEEARNRMAKIADREIIVYHDSFDYFAEEFDIDIEHILSDSEGKLPNQKDIAKAVREIKEENAACIFTQESFADVETLRSVAKQADCDIVLIDTLTSGAEDGNDKDAYINAVRRNMDIIEQNFQ